MMKMFDAELWQGFPKEGITSTNVPVYQVTDGSVPTIHRFYDTTPISPSGRYIALNELATEDRLPNSSDVGAVFVIDIQTGYEVFRAETRAWDTQLGAHAQWGASDNELYFNDRSISGLAFSRKVNIFSSEEKSLKCPVYMVSPSGRYIAYPNMEKLSLVQPGYGFVVNSPEAFRHSGAPQNDGLFLYNSLTESYNLVLTMQDIVRAFPAEFSNLDMDGGGLYGFHVKWSPDEKQILFIVRWLPKDKVARGTKNFLISYSLETKELHMPVNPERWLGGHHPNWCPDSRHIIMNLARQNGNPLPRRLISLIGKVFRRLGFRTRLGLPDLFFYRFTFDGQVFEELAPPHIGSGHPSISPDGRFLLTDAYTSEPVADGDGTVPLRLIDLTTGAMKILAKVDCKPAFNGSLAELRIDPHPVWSKDGQLIVFNGKSSDKRAVYVADLSALLEKQSGLEARKLTI